MLNFATRLQRCANHQGKSLLVAASSTSGATQCAGYSTFYKYQPQARQRDGLLLRQTGRRAFATQEDKDGETGAEKVAEETASPDIAAEEEALLGNMQTTLEEGQAEIIAEAAETPAAETAEVA